MIIASGRPVITMGGFFGGDPTPTSGPTGRLSCRSGELRYVFVPDTPVTPYAPLPNPSSWSRTVLRDALWVESHGSVVSDPPHEGHWSGTLYDLRPQR